MVASRASRLAIHLYIDRLFTLDMHRACTIKSDLRQSLVLASTDDGQQFERAQQGYVVNGTDIEEAITGISMRVDTKACPIGWSVGNGHQDKVMGLRFFRLLPAIKPECQPGAVAIAEE